MTHNYHQISSQIITFNGKHCYEFTTTERLIILSTLSSDVNTVRNLITNGITIVCILFIVLPPTRVFGCRNDRHRCKITDKAALLFILELFRTPPQNPESGSR